MHGSMSSEFVHHHCKNLWLCVPCEVVASRFIGPAVPRYGTKCSAHSSLPCRRQVLRQRVPPDAVVLLPARRHRAWSLATLLGFCASSSSLRSRVRSLVLCSSLQPRQRGWPGPACFSS